MTRTRWTSCRRNPLNSPLGFTLVEMLAVVAIIALLLSLLLPSFSRANDAAEKAVCAGNLHGLHRALQLDPSEPPNVRLPSAGSWLAVAADRAGSEPLICPSDEEPHGGGEGIDEIRIVQWGHDGVNTEVMLTDIFEGRSLADPQISWWTNSSHHRGSQLAGENEFRSAIGLSDWSDLPHGQVAVSVDFSGRFVADRNNGVITVYHKFPDNLGGGSSKHFLYDSNGEIAEIGGGAYQGQAPHEGYRPPLEINLSDQETSYAMNTQVNTQLPRPSQILLTDYEQKSIINIDEDGHQIDDFEELFAPRHIGKGNALRNDGSVIAHSRGELLANPKYWNP